MLQTSSPRMARLGFVCAVLVSSFFSFLFFADADDVVPQNAAQTPPPLKEQSQQLQAARAFGKLLSTEQCDKLKNRWAGERKTFHSCLNMYWEANLSRTTAASEWNFRAQLSIQCAEGALEGGYQYDRKQYWFPEQHGLSLNENLPDYIASQKEAQAFGEQLAATSQNVITCKQLYFDPNLDFTQEVNAPEFLTRLDSVLYCEKGFLNP